jgi:16S rRNA (uracil1498-N3)-methyltransferase
VVRLRSAEGRAVTERRLHVTALPKRGGALALDQAASRHVRVLRLRPGDRIELFDGRGNAAAAYIESLGEHVVCVAEPPTRTARCGARVVLILGLPKGSKLDDCVRMATELGVDEIALMRTERSVPRWDTDKARARIDRLARIAAEAAAQSERSDVPVVHLPRPCGALLDTIPPDARGLVFGARATSALELHGTPEQVWCAVGPEGGFSDHELASFEAAGFSRVSLGPTILRVDTAVAAALAVVQDRLRTL